MPRVVAALVPVVAAVAALVVAVMVRVATATARRVDKASTVAAVMPITATAIRVAPAVIAQLRLADRFTIRWPPMKMKAAKPALRLPVIAVRLRVVTAVPHRVEIAVRLRQVIVVLTAKARAMMDPVERVRAIRASVLKASATPREATRPAVIVRKAPAPAPRVTTVVPITMEGAPKASALRAIAQMVIVQVAGIAHSAALAKWPHVAASEL